MKKPIAFIILFVLFHKQQLNAEKLALIVGITKYPVSSGWSELDTDRDVDLISNALVKKGFKSENISILRNQEATLAGLRLALNNLLLNTQYGDVIYFHFSGHGHSIEDDGDDELDGLDEVLVPFDAIFPISTPSQFNFYLRDDELGVYFDKIAQKAGHKGDVLITLDACYSGTGIRGFGKARGGQKPSILLSTKKQGSHYNEKRIFELPNKLAPITIITGSQAWHQNFQIKDGDYDMGSLSYCFSKALMESDSLTTYNGLFTNIQSIFQSKLPNTYQSPTIETEFGNKRVLGGKLSPKTTYYTFQNRSDSNCILKAGTLDGVTEGTILLIYNPDFLVTDIPIDTGLVIQSDHLKSKVKLSKNMDFNPNTVWAVISEKGIIDYKLTIHLSDELSYIKKGLAKIPYLLISEKIDHSDLQLRLVNTNSIGFIDANTSIEFFEIEFNPSKKEHMVILIEKLRNFNRYYYINKLNYTENHFIDCDVNLELFKNGKQIKNENNFKLNDTLKIHYRNNGPAVFLQILALSPQGKVEIVFPDQNDQEQIKDSEIQYQSENYLNGFITLNEPLGKYTLKVILTQRPLNLLQITTHELSVNNLNQTSIMDIFKVINEENKTRGATYNFNASKTTIKKSESLRVYNIPFTVSK